MNLTRKIQVITNHYSEEFCFLGTLLLNVHGSRDNGLWWLLIRVVKLRIFAHACADLGY